VREETLYNSSAKRRYFYYMKWCLTRHSARQLSSGSPTDYGSPKDKDLVIENETPSYL
jgi:hypothetical protein